MPWIAGTIIIIVLSFMPNLLATLANFAGVRYPPTFLFFISTLVILLIIMYQGIQISNLQDKCREMSQNLALLYRHDPNRQTDFIQSDEKEANG